MDVYLKPKILPCPLNQHCHFCSWVGDAGGGCHTPNHKSTRREFIGLYYDGFFNDEHRMRACKTCRFYLRSPREYLTWHEDELIDMDNTPLGENLGVATNAHELSCHEDIDSVIDL